jgi:hypothetical protein
MRKEEFRSKSGKSGKTAIQNGRNRVESNLPKGLSDNELSLLVSSRQQSRVVLNEVITKASRQILAEHLPLLGVKAESEEFNSVHEFGIIGTTSLLSKLSSMPGFSGILSMAGGGNSAMMAPVVESINDIAPAIVKIMHDRGFVISDKGSIILLAFSIIAGHRALDVATAKAVRFEGQRVWIKAPTLMSFIPELNAALSTIKK